MLTMYMKKMASKIEYFQKSTVGLSVEIFLVKSNLQVSFEIEFFYEIDFFRFVFQIGKIRSILNE